METKEQREERIKNDQEFMRKCFRDADNITAQALAPSERNEKHDEGFRNGYWMAKRQELDQKIENGSSFSGTRMNVFKAHHPEGRFSFIGAKDEVTARAFLMSRGVEIILIDEHYNSVDFVCMDEAMAKKVQRLTEAYTEIREEIKEIIESEMIECRGDEDCQHCLLAQKYCQ